jgi:hypothetical protein
MSCCSKPVARIIKVAEFEAGLVGLDEALRNVYISGLDDEAGIQRDLLKWIKDFGNYIAPSREKDYQEALLREYKKYAESMENREGQERSDVMPTPEEVLDTKKTYALIGASQDSEKYSHELLVTMLKHGYTMYPINPRYEEIEGKRCYASLAHLPEKPEVVIVALAPRNAESVLSQVAEQSISIVWLTPGSSSAATLEMAQGFGLDVIHDACPVGILSMKHIQSRER